MRSVKEMSEKTGVSPRTLHHYDAIGLLKPSHTTDAGYRWYDDAALERLYLILLFRELGLSLKEIRQVLDDPDFDRNRVLDKQIGLLKAKVAHLHDCIHLANAIKQTGVTDMKFKNNGDYSAQAKALYGKTDAYKEYEKKSGARTEEENKSVNDRLMDHFVRLGQLKDLSPDCEAAQAWVKELQTFLSANYYNCTNQILMGLGQMYAGGGSMTENIDAAGGTGTGEFACRAIEIYCK